MQAVRHRFLDLAKANEPYIEQMAEAAARVVRSGRYVGGSEIEALEQELCRLTGAPHAVAVSNGLDALRLTLRAAVINGLLAEGDEVIVPANTYIASVLAIVDAGLSPMLAEPSELTLNLDTSRLKERLTPRTRALMPVHLYGRVCWDSNLVDFVRANNLFVIEDNAQAIGARSASVPGLFGSDSAAALGHAGALSFYPTKNIGAVGDAGAVITHLPEIAHTVRALANYGADRRYHNIHAGFNCRMDPIQAAMLMVKLPHTLQENADRFERVLVYERTISHPQVVKPAIPPTLVDHVWHQYVIRVTGAPGSRDRLRAALLEQGIETDIHYATPPHCQPCFAQGGLDSSHLSTLTQQLANQLVSLPLGRGLTLDDIAEISLEINNIQL